MQDLTRPGTGPCDQPDIDQAGQAWWVGEGVERGGAGKGLGRGGGGGGGVIKRTQAERLRSSHKGLVSKKKYKKIEVQCRR